MTTRLATRLDTLFDRRFFPATKEELIDFALRQGAPPEVLTHLQSLDEEETFFNVDDLLELNEDVSDFFNYEDNE